MIDYEVSSVTFWVSVDDNKPIGLLIFEKGGYWQHEILKENPTEEEQELMKGFAHKAIGDMHKTWKLNMRKHLLWNAENLSKPTHQDS